MAKQDVAGDVSVVRIITPPLGPGRRRGWTRSPRNLWVHISVRSRVPFVDDARLCLQGTEVGTIWSWRTIVIGALAGQFCYRRVPEEIVRERCICANSCCVAGLFSGRYTTALTWIMGSALASASMTVAATDTLSIMTPEYAVWPGAAATLVEVGVTFTGVSAEPAFQVIGTVTAGHVLALIFKFAVPIALVRSPAVTTVLPVIVWLLRVRSKAFSRRWYPPLQEREFARPVLLWYRSHALGVIASARSDLRLARHRLSL